MEEVRAHERALVAQAMDGLGKLDGVRLLGHPAPEKRIGALCAHDRGRPARARRQHPQPRGRDRGAQRLLLRPPVPAPAARAHRHHRAAPKARRGRGGRPAGAVRPSFGIFNDEREVDELVRMIRLIRDRGWKGDYLDIPRAAACRSSEPQSFGSRTRSSGSVASSGTGRIRSRSSGPFTEASRCSATQRGDEPERQPRSAPTSPKTSGFGASGAGGIAAAPRSLKRTPGPRSAASAGVAASGPAPRGPPPAGSERARLSARRGARTPPRTSSG
jgi:hypothetical protein